MISQYFTRGLFLTVEETEALLRQHHGDFRDRFRSERCENEHRPL